MMRRIFGLLLVLWMAAAAAHAQTNDLVAVTSVNSRIRLDIRYATTNNFTGQAVYPCAKAYLRKNAAAKLGAAQTDLECRGLGLKVWDAYRPLAVQKKFWTIVPDERYVADPAKGSRHNRGSAVDVTLVRLDNGRELSMPSAYDDFTDRAHYTYTNLPPEIIQNRALLRATMVRHGFIPFPTEWWHFDDAGWASDGLLDIDLATLP